MLVLDRQQQGAGAGNGEDAKADEQAPDGEADDAQQQPDHDDAGADSAEVAQAG